MAKFSNVNQLPLTGPLAMYSVKTVLLSAGWTVTKSGDGLALYSAAGDIITGGGAVAGGLGNTRAYFVVTDAATKVTISFQTISNTTYRVKYSETGAMNAGSPNSTTTGTATDEQILYGAGTDSSPTGTQMLHTDNTYRFHMYANSTAQTGNGTYPFWFGGTISATGVSASFFGLDGMSNGTYNSLDTAPRAFLTWYDATGGVSAGWHATADTNFYVRGWVAYGLGNAAFKRFSMAEYLVNTLAGLETDAVGGFGTATFNTGPYAAEDAPLPLLVSRVAGHGTLPGPKGFFADFKATSHTGRSYPDTILNATDAYVYIGKLLAPWPETISPSL